MSERELQTISELKQAEIATVVTRGLDPNVPMKESGIEWIGQIPAHWEIKYLSQIAEEHYISNKDVHHQNLLSLSYGRIVRKDINTTEGLLPASFDTYQVIEKGNIILRLTDLQNDHKSLRIGLVTEEGIITSAYICIQSRRAVLPEYLYLLLHSYDICKVFYPKSVIRISRCCMAMRSPLISPRWTGKTALFLKTLPDRGYACPLFYPNKPVLRLTRIG